MFGHVVGAVKNEYAVNPFSEGALVVLTRASKRQQSAESMYWSSEYIWGLNCLTAAVVAKAISRRVVGVDPVNYGLNL